MNGPFLVHDLTDPLPAEYRKGVIAIGNFDGVHRGHQMVLRETLSAAREKGVPALVLTFEPHPRTLFKPESPVFRLTPAPMKARILEAFGMDGMLILPFTKEVAATSAEDFVKTVLCDAAGASHVISGFNFHFGKGRRGTPDFLKESGERHGFEVTIIEPHADDTEQAISSSRIRRALGAGAIEDAADMLGYRWTVAGEVVSGASLGRTLGYPTANLSLPENCHLAHGIYAVRLRGSDDVLRNGVASFGRRPTFDNGAPLLETFIFDFSGDIYGHIVEVSLFSRLRGEEKFASAEELVVQMDKDSAAARAILQEARALSELDRKLTFEGLVE